MFSGGVGSWAAADRVRREQGRNITLVFADTLIEDADLYRFLIEAAADVLGHAGRGEVSGLAARALNTPPSSDMPARRAHLTALRADTLTVLTGLVWLVDGRTPWEVFRDRRFLGKAKTAHCSQELKQKVCNTWLSAHCDPASTIVSIGIDAMEEHRFTFLRGERAKDGWTYRAPLCEPPEPTKDAMFARLLAAGIREPRLYAMGFSHNNCGGGCVRAGIGHFAHLYKTLPAVYEEWEQGEQGVREYLGRDDIAMLRDRRGGRSRPLTLTQLRRRIVADEPIDLFDIGGCGCFVSPSPSSDAA